MLVALTLPNTVTKQEPSRWGVEQAFDALSSDALNTSFFMPAPQEASLASNALQDLSALRTDGQSKQIAEETRVIMKLNQDFADLAFSVRDFNRVSVASDPQPTVVAPPIRLREDKEKLEKAQQQNNDLQLAA